MSVREQPSRNRLPGLGDHQSWEKGHGVTGSSHKARMCGHHVHLIAGLRRLRFGAFICPDLQGQSVAPALPRP